LQIKTDKLIKIELNLRTLYRVTELIKKVVVVRIKIIENRILDIERNNIKKLIIAYNFVFMSCICTADKNHLLNLAPIFRKRKKTVQYDLFNYGKGRQIFGT